MRKSKQCELVDGEKLTSYSKKHYVPPGSAAVFLIRHIGSCTIPKANTVSVALRKSRHRDDDGVFTDRFFAAVIPDNATIARVRGI